jgi:hypothetical protein
MLRGGFLVATRERDARCHFVGRKDFGRALGFSQHHGYCRLLFRGIRFLGLEQCIGERARS